MASKTVVSLEITEESVRALEVTLGPNPTLVAYGDVPLPAGAAKDSEVLDVDAVAVALQQLWAQSGITSRKVVLAVGNRRILVREYAAPHLPLDQIKAALPYQVQDLLPVPVNQAVLDFYPIGEENGMVNGLLVAAVSETMEDLVAAAVKAKLYVESIDLVPFGLARAVQRMANAHEAAAVFHIGDHTTYVVIAIDGVPRFVRIVPADVRTTATESRTTVEVLEAEPVEVAVVSEANGRSSLRVRAAAAREDATAHDEEDFASVSELANRLRSTLAFFAGRPGALPVAQVFVSGAGAANAALIPALQSALNRPVRVVDVSAIANAKGAAPQGELALNLLGTIGVVLGDGKKR
ncbi:MAG: pilus assembly protein PilM [Microbacterium sp.]